MGKMFNLDLSLLFTKESNTVMEGLSILAKAK